MDWYRRYHGTCADPKFRLAARGAGVPTPFAISAWDAILEHASAHDERGCIGGLTAELLAMTVDIAEAEAERLLAEFARRGMLADDRVASWEKRQRASDDSAARVRKHRQKAVVTEPEEANGNGSCNVTNGTGNVTSQEGNDTYPRERASEQNRAEQIVPPNGGTAAPPKAKAVLWDEMRAQIGGNKPGSLVGKWIKLHGEGEVFAAHFAAMGNMPADYVEWMTKRLQANGKPYAVRSTGKSYIERVQSEHMGDDDGDGYEALLSIAGPAALMCPGGADTEH
jgi:hypothetical protein